MLVAVPAHGANAYGKPIREFLPAVTGTFSIFCGFPVDVEVPVNNEYITTFFDKDGNPIRSIISGHLVGSFTNVETDKSIVRNNSGPVLIDFNKDGSVTVTATGVEAVFLLPTDPGGPGLVIASGPTVIQIDPNGVTTSLTIRHVMEDVCAELSG
jgi:hypothetical protein